MQKRIIKVLVILLWLLIPMSALFIPENKWNYFVWGVVSFFALLYLIKNLRQFQLLRSDNHVIGSLIAFEEIEQERYSVPNYKIKVEFLLAQKRYEIEAVIDSPPVKTYKIYPNKTEPQKSIVITEINWAFVVIALIAVLFFGSLSIWGLFYK
jgi:hypothetical protein